MGGSMATRWDWFDIHVRAQNKVQKNHGYKSSLTLTSRVLTRLHIAGLSSVAVLGQHPLNLQQCSLKLLRICRFSHCCRVVFFSSGGQRSALLWSKCYYSGVSCATSPSPPSDFYSRCFPSFFFFSLTLHDLLWISYFKLLTEWWRRDQSNGTENISKYKTPTANDHDVLLLSLIVRQKADAYALL